MKAKVLLTVLVLSLFSAFLAGCGEKKAAADPADPSLVTNTQNYEPKVGGPGIPNSGGANGAGKK